MVLLEEAVNAEFVALAIGSFSSQSWLMEQAKGGTYTGINIRNLARLPVTIPHGGNRMKL